MEDPDAPAQQIRRTYRYRLYPTHRQVEALRQQLAFCCDLYNAAIQERRDAWKHGARVGYVDQAAQLTEIRREGLSPQDMNCWTQQQVLKLVDLAFAAFFSRCKSGQKPGYPRFRSRRRYDSLYWSFTGNAGGVAIVDRRLRLQGVGCVKVKWHRDIPKRAVLRAVTVTRSGDRWYASFSLQMEAPAVTPHEGPDVGLDLGVACFARLSTGELVEGPRAGSRAAGKTRRHQRKVARCKRGSNRRRKAVAVLARAREHEANIRRDHRHKVAREMVRRFSLFYVEDLKIGNMTRSAKGTVEAPGRNVRQKAGLNRSILDQGWGGFLTVLEQKAEEAAALVVRVPAAYTSQTCAECGVVDARSRPSQAVFACVACGHRDHADANAAKVIQALGRRVRAPTVEVAHAVA